MFSFNSGSTTKPRFALFKALAVPLCLITAFLFLGCPMEGSSGGGSINSGFVDTHQLNRGLISTWSASNSGGDGYQITGTKLTYKYGSDITYAGTIKYVFNFSETAGVIIIEYDVDHQQKYYEDNDHWGDPDYEVLPKGHFLGVYYKNLTPSSVEMGGAYIDGGAEKATLEAAKRVFTLDNEGIYMTYYGPYAK